MRKIPFYIVDAFSTIRFQGNPASVCLMDTEIPEATMQAIAAEMNHSETAFTLSIDGGPTLGKRFSLRWFTPAVEVPLCGHATLATAAVILYELANPAQAIRFETKSGTLSARREGSRITLDFPAADCRGATPPPEVCAALGAEGVIAACYAREDRNLLLQLGSESEVRDLAPDFRRLEAARGEERFHGIIVTAHSSGQFDFISRYFAPWLGIDEDPVTGAAHCALAPYWARLTGKHEMRAYQASRRGGEMTVRVRGERVELAGEAVTVAAGTIRLD